MRAILLTLAGGILLGAALSGILFRGDRESRSPSRPPGPISGQPPRRESGSGPEIGRLLARIAELEAALRLAALALPDTEETPEATDAAEIERSLADVETLYALVDDGDARGLAREILRLLDAGEEGYPVLVEFLRGELHSPRKTLLNSRPLLAALLGLAFRHGEEVAGFARHLLDSSEEIGDAALAGRLRSLLPAFLAYHGSRFASLRGAFEERLIAEFSVDGDARWEALAAMTEMGVAAPAEILAELVARPGDKKHYRLLMKHILRRRDRAGLDALIAYLDSAAYPAHWSVEQALHTLGRLDLPEAGAFLEQYAGAPEDSFRTAAELARKSRSIESALEYLNSPLDMSRKRQLVRHVARLEPELLGEIKLNLTAIDSEETRSMVEQDGRDVTVSTIDRLVLAKLNENWVVAEARRDAHLQSTAVNYVDVDGDGNLEARIVAVSHAQAVAAADAAAGTEAPSPHDGSFAAGSCVRCHVEPQAIPGTDPAATDSATTAPAAGEKSTPPVSHDGRR